MGRWAEASSQTRGSPGAVTHVLPPQSGADVDYKDDHVSVIAIGESTEERPVAD